MMNTYSDDTIPRNNPNHSTVPKTFKGSLKAKLDYVFKDPDGCFTFKFLISDEDFQGCQVRRRLDFSKEWQVKYYTKLFEEYGVELSEETVSKLNGKFFLLRFDFYRDEDGLERQRIWVNSFGRSFAPDVVANINQTDCTFTFDNSPRIPHKGETGFKIWLGLKVWSFDKMKNEGRPACGYFRYPKELFTF